MVRVVMCDLETLIDSQRRPLPHVTDALASIQNLRGPGGKNLASCLVSDFTMPDPPATPAKVRSIFGRYLSILDSTGLRPFFEPVEKRVTLSTHAGVLEPAKEIFLKALSRLGVRVPLSGCLLITENVEHVRFVRERLQMQALQFRGSGTAGFDFDDWSQAPLLIAHLISPAIDANTEVALGAFLRSAHDVDLESVRPASNRSDLVNVRAKTWHAVAASDLGSLNGVLVGVPVEGQVKLGPRGEAHSVRLAEPPAEHVREAESFVRSLARNNQIDGRPGGTVGATHQVEVDPQGRRKLTRKRYSAT